MALENLERARRLLCDLQDLIRDAVIAARVKQGSRFSQVSAVTAADTIYHVDRISEGVIIDWFERRWPRNWPVELVMEGLEDEAVTFPPGKAIHETRFKCIIDPIDGTRGLMYDKRSAWILAAVAPQRGARTQLGDIEVAAMTEVPTTKQWRADQFSVVRGAGLGGIVARSWDTRENRWAKLAFAPSRAKNFDHGFASLARFFPSGKALTAEIEERLWERLRGPQSQPALMVFDDQYISTGGQLVELLVGHDRMIGDIRPLVFAKLGLPTALTCHPYDICTALILQEAGGIVEAPTGLPLAGPLDTTSPVAWMGYANAALARKVRPVLRRVLAEYLR